MSNESFSGGEKLKALLTKYAANLRGNPEVLVGFFAGSTESKTGIPSAQAAALNEYGSVHTIQSEDGSSKKINIPPRPFFRYMVNKGKPHWGADLGRELIASDMNANTALNELGRQMKEELHESIEAQDYAPLKQSTIDRKGHDTTLFDSGDMKRAADYQVKI